MSIYFGNVGVAGNNGERGKIVKVIPDFSGYSLATIKLKNGSKTQYAYINIPKRWVESSGAGSEGTRWKAAEVKLWTGSSVKTFNINTFEPTRHCAPDYENPIDIRAEAESSTGYTLLSTGYIQFFDHYDKSSVLTSGYEISGTIDDVNVYNSRVDVTVISDGLSVNDSAVNQIIIPVASGSVVKVGSCDQSRGPANNLEVKYYPIVVNSEYPENEYV